MSKIIGIDIGYGWTKVVWGNGQGLKSEKFPSAVGIFEEGLNLKIEGLKTSEREIVQVDGNSFLIGVSALKHSARLLNSREKDWIDSTAYNCLLRHGLRLAGVVRGMHLKIVTGLPVSFYRAGKNKLANTIKKVAVEIGCEAEVKIIPQPLGSFFNLLFDDIGIIQDERLAEGKTGVLDIGFYTTDLITVNELEVIEKQIDSFENGVSSGMELISKDIEALFGIRPDLHKIEEAIKNGSIKVFGKLKDISEISEKRFSELASEISAQSRTLWKAGADIDSIILTGGGSNLIGKHLIKTFSHARLTSNPQTANALGFYKLGRHV